VLAEGWYEDELFHVTAFGFPPAEPSKTTRYVAVCSFIWTAKGRFAVGSSCHLLATFYTLKRKAAAWINSLVECRVSNWNVAKPWFNFWCGSASLCPSLNVISHLGAKQSTHRGALAWLKTCKQNSFCVGVVWQTQSI